MYCILSKLNPENGRKFNIQEFIKGNNDTSITQTGTITSVSKLEQRLMSINVEMKNNSVTLMIIGKIKRSDSSRMYHCVLIGQKMKMGMTLLHDPKWQYQVKGEK